MENSDQREPLLNDPSTISNRGCDLVNRLKKYEEDPSQMHDTSSGSLEYNTKVTAAYSTFGLTLADNAYTNDDIIIQAYANKILVSPDIREELLDGLAIVGQHRKSQDIIDLVSKATLKDALEYIDVARTATDDQVIAQFLARYGTPLTTTDEKACKALQIIAECRDSEDLIAFALGQKFRSTLAPQNSPQTISEDGVGSKEFLSDSDVESKDLEAQLDSQWEIAAYQGAIGIENAEPVRATVNDGNMMNNGNAQKNPYGSEENPIATEWSAPIINVIVGRKPNCHQFFVHQHVMMTALGRLNHTELREDVHFLQQVRLENVNPSIFGDLLREIYLHHDILDWA